jgi:hypothetical protein
MGIDRENRMASPFPGMDPYLEAHWGDVHTRLITYASTQLQKVLPKDLRARVEERLVVTAPDLRRPIFPDVRIFEKKRKAPRISNGAVGLMTATEPLVIELPGEPETQRSLEIREVGTGSRLITTLEILSPSNKRSGETKDQYVRKQKELLHARVNLVEIDLLRKGDWVLAAPLEVIDADVRTPYRVLVRRGGHFLQVEYYPILLREQLPVVRIPLRPTDADVPLDLQTLVAQAYEDGGYDDDIDYSVPADPPLSGAEARWSARLLRQQGHRRKGKKR